MNRKCNKAQHLAMKPREICCLLLLVFLAVFHFSSLISFLFVSFLFPFSGGKTFSDQTVCYVRKQGVLSGWEQDFPNISLAIPPKTYPTLISCKCIAVLYFILVSNLFPFVKVKVKLAHEPEDPFILRDFTSNSLKAGRHSK